MTNRDIAAVFEQVADLLEFQAANPFRIRAYRNAARRISDLTESVSTIADDPERALTDLEGIGRDMAEKIETLLVTGTLPMLDELRATIPESVLDLLRVPNLGPKKAAALYNELGIATLDQLKIACESGDVEELKGFGKKTAEKILAGIDLAARAGKRIYWAKADAIVQDVLAHLGGEPGGLPIMPAGSYRRGKETVGDLDFLATADDAATAAALMDRFSTFDPSAETIVRGETKMSIRLQSGLQVDLRVVPADSFGAALQYFTGSKDHNVMLRGIAKDRGLKINEWGVFRVEPQPASGGRKPPVTEPTPALSTPDLPAPPPPANYLAGRTEEEVYAALNLPCFPPELREARQEFDAAMSGELPTLVELADIRGDLHMHTTASDGKATIEEMVAAARHRGLAYIAITDHSKRVAMAGGLDGDRLLKQWSEIDVINAALGEAFTVLKGIECDILEAGGMDLPDEVLAEADWVIASIHYGQSQSRDQITNRIIGTLQNPHVDILAHPTGRLIDRRDPYAVDMDAVMQAAAAEGKMLELNANPARLDLNDIHCAAAKRHGVPVVISTDAHREEQLDYLRCGILQARRGGLTAADVANTRPWPW